MDISGETKPNRDSSSLACRRQAPLLGMRESGSLQERITFLPHLTAPNLNSTGSGVRKKYRRADAARANAVAAASLAGKRARAGKCDFEGVHHDDR
ncbi:MAG: hypothetical protein DMG38_00525 [Acidobacteria bacterium]|nr:MAG: hypothetical protein DMG38_00525 [Acidobacteriota bacterium]